MHETKLEYDGNNAVLRLITHTGESVGIQCDKTDTQSFRMSFTGANEILVVTGVVTEVFDDMVVADSGGKEIRAIRILTDQLQVGQNVHLTEYYGLHMEFERPGFVASIKPIQEPRLLFINVDCLDGGGNLIKRYRVSPYDGSYRVMSDE